MPTIELYTQAAKTYSGGALDTGNGVGLPEVSPLLTNWVQTSAPPNGWGTDLNMGITDAWCHGSGEFANTTYFYAVVNEAGGTGRGIYRYLLDYSADPISMSYDGYVPIGNLGLSGTEFLGSRSIVFDSSEESVLICTRGTSGTVTPVCGKWLMSNWPFSSANATWKAVSQTTGSYVVNNVIDSYIPFLDITNGKVFLSSLGSGNVVIHNWSSGTLWGQNPFYIGYSAEYPMQIFGRSSGGFIASGGYRATQTSGAMVQFQVSSPSSWTNISTVLSPQTTYDHGFGRQYAHTRNLLLGSLYRAYPLQENEISILNPETFGWSTNGNVIAYFESEPHKLESGLGLVFTEGATSGNYQELCLQKPSSYGRAGYGTYFSGSPFCFLSINGNPWFLAPSDGSQDMYSEDSRGPKYTKGIAATHCGVGIVDYTINITEMQVPKRILVDLGVNGSLVPMNSEHSDHLGKHRFSISINGSSFSTYSTRSGSSEILNLNSAINSKTAWPTLSYGDTVVIRHEIHSGLVGNFSSVAGNPDSYTPAGPGLGQSRVPIADFGPPRDVKIVLDTDKSEVGGGFL